jgi:RHS repeat-associated protein
MTYDGLGRLLTLTDPEERTVSFEWCGCGQLGRLTVEDPTPVTTIWHRDIQGRVTSKELPDGSNTTYEYEPATNRIYRILDSTEPTAQKTVFSYDLANDLTGKQYVDETIATPDVTFEWDPIYPRVTMMSDGTGDTTYSYRAVGQTGALKLAMVNPPHDMDVQHYSYDPLGRLYWRLLNGTPVEVLEYDELDRVVSQGTPGTGPFTFEYDGTSPRFSDVQYPNGQVTSFTYHPGAADRAIETIRNYLPESGELRGGEYTFFAEGALESELELPSGTASKYATYDGAGQLETFGQGTPLYEYAYSRGNIVDQSGPDLDASHFNVNDVNAITTEEPGIGGELEYEYDLNGNLVSRETASGTITYEWDAENRLVAVNAGTHRSEFIYNGIGQRARMVEIEDSSTVSDRGYLWCGGQVCGEFEYQDTGGEPYWLYFRRGLFRIGNTQSQRYLTLDRLGSVLDMTDKTGAVKASYAYDPFGNATKLAGEEDSPLTYASYLAHGPTGLNLTWSRAYDAKIGRWLSRDPLGEAAGANLYAYVNNSPLNYIDPLGLDVSRCCRDVDVNAVVDTVASVVGAQHCFIKTDTVEAGMGPAGGGPLPMSPCYGTQTAVVSHAGQAGSSQCQVVPNVDEECVNRGLAVGTPTGGWARSNNCNTFVDDLIRLCTIGPPCPRRVPMPPVRPPF